MAICFQPFHKVFTKTALFFNLKKSFSKSVFPFFISSLFILIYEFSQTFRLNLMDLLTFFKTNQWFNAYFKFVICITYSPLSCKFATSFATFSIFILSGKKVNLCHCKGYVNFQDINHQLLEKYLSSLL